MQTLISSDTVRTAGALAMNNPTASTPTGATGDYTTLGTVARVVVPSGALTSTVTIAIAVAGPAPSLPGVTALSPLYTFTPNDEQFAIVCSIAIFVEAYQSGASLYWSNLSGGYDVFSASLVDGFVVGDVGHFSQGFIGLGSGGASAVSGGSAGGGAPAVLDYGPAYLIDGQIVYESEMRAYIERRSLEDLRDLVLVDTPDLYVVVELPSALTSMETVTARAGAEYGEPDVTTDAPETRTFVDGGDEGES